MQCSCERARVKKVHTAVLHFSFRDKCLHAHAFLCVAFFVCMNHEEKRPFSCQLRSGPDTVGCTLLPPRWAERQGEDSSASGKQSGPNWSLTGLTCLHLLVEMEDPSAWPIRAAVGPDLPPHHRLNHREVNPPSAQRSDMSYILTFCFCFFFCKETLDNLCGHSLFQGSSFSTACTLSSYCALVLMKLSPFPRYAHEP